MKKFTTIMVLLVFILGTILPPQALAQSISGVAPMPEPGTMTTLSPAYTPAQLFGITIDPSDPLKFSFIINKGDMPLSESQKKTEYSQLIKYFLAALAVPDNDQWVNLSPYEGSRIINDNFGLTEMGRDLLAQDYFLKQLTASLMHPDGSLGKAFWASLYEKTYAKYGTTDIPVDTFNKIWITPAKALVYEKHNSALIAKSGLNVLTERDFLALENNAIVRENGQMAASDASNELAQITSDVVKDILLPEIKREVNFGKSFANLRQIYSGMVLATWYKQAVKESMLSKIYADKSIIKGVDHDPKENEAIFKQYVEAFQKGAFNMIREDMDKYSQELIPRKYFSGGFQRPDSAMQRTEDPTSVPLGNTSTLDYAEIKVTENLEAQQPTDNAEQTLPPNQPFLVEDQQSLIIKAGGTRYTLSVQDSDTIVIRGTFNDQELTLLVNKGKTIVIGRNTDKFFFSDERLSRQHFQLRVLDIRNGTFDVEITPLKDDNPTHIETSEPPVLSSAQQQKNQTLMIPRSDPIVLKKNAPVNLSITGPLWIRAHGETEHLFRISGQNGIHSLQEYSADGQTAIGNPITIRDTTDSPFTIGRATDNDVVIGDPAISGKHLNFRIATLYSAPQAFQITITNTSTNGTTVAVESGTDQYTVQHNIRQLRSEEFESKVGETTIISNNQHITTVTNPLGQILSFANSTNAEGETTVTIINRSNDSGEPRPAQAVSESSFVQQIVQASIDQMNQEDNAAGVEVTPGGIDFAQSNLNMEIKRDGNGMILPAAQQNWDNIKIDGLRFEILAIAPVTELPMLK